MEQVIEKKLIIIETDNESHGGEILGELFCVTGKDLDLIDIDDLY